MVFCPQELTISETPISCLCDSDAYWFVVYKSVFRDNKSTSLINHLYDLGKEPFLTLFPSLYDVSHGNILEKMEMVHFTEII